MIHKKCECAGIGRQARLRCVCRRHAGSSPATRTSRMPRYAFRVSRLFLFFARKKTFTQTVERLRRSHAFDAFSEFFLANVSYTINICRAIDIQRKTDCIGYMSKIRRVRWSGVPHFCILRRNKYSSACGEARALALRQHSR